MKKTIIPQGTVTSPKGFVASGFHAGIKKNKLDTALILSTSPAVAGATFTRNTAKAWPVLWSKKAVQHRTHRAIFGTSGNANCFNGDGGREAVRRCVKFLSAKLGIAEDEVLIAQTGIIGRAFPTAKVLKGIPPLIETLAPDGGHRAAQGILTTDRQTKEIAVSFTIEGKEVRIGGCAKGAGMLNPNMATMLCFITTDAAIGKAVLRQALKEAVDDTFNQICIDNDMSTNDTVFILANGQAGNPKILTKGSGYKIFVSQLKRVCRTIAKGLVKDGEGVNRVAEIKVTGARNPREAKIIARQIGQSMLFKTMLAGGDPNWGRVVAAVGSTKFPFDPKRLDVSFEGVKVLNHGRVHQEQVPALRKKLQRKQVDVAVNLNLGRGEARFLTCDLTQAYVRINAWLTT